MKKILSVLAFCAICIAFPIKGNAQYAFIGEITSMSNSNSYNPIPVNDGSTATIMTISAWGGPTMMQAVLQFNSGGGEMRTDLLPITSNNGNLIYASNGEWMQYAVEAITIDTNTKTFMVVYAGVSYFGTITQTVKL